MEKANEDKVMKVKVQCSVYYDTLNVRSLVLTTLQYLTGEKKTPPKKLSPGHFKIFIFILNFLN